MAQQKDYLVLDENTMLRPRVRALAEPAIGADDGQRVQYTSFDGKTYTVTRFNGKYVAILLQDSWLSALTVDERRIFLDRADILYQHYRDLLGAEPFGDGLDTIATVPTCGYGCGIIGGKNIEISDDSGAIALVKKDLDAGHVPEVLTHEMGHNFDLYSAYWEYAPVDGHAWTDLVQPFIKLWDREGSMDGPATELLSRLYSVPGAVSGFYDPYFSNAAFTWQNCVKTSNCSSDSGFPDHSWAGIMHRMVQLHGEEVIRGALAWMRNYKAGHATPPTTAEDKEDLHVEALAAGSGLNLGCYVDTWRWFASAALRARMTTAYGSANAFCQDNDHDGYTPLTGDLNDSNAAIHPGAAEILNGVDDDCDGVIDDLLYTEPAGGDFPNPMPVHFPARIAGRITAASPSDKFTFTLPAAGKVRFTLRSTPDFQGWLFLYKQNSNEWLQTEYVTAGSFTSSEWDLPNAGTWMFEVALNTSSNPGQYTVEIATAPRWPAPWGDVQTPILPPIVFGGVPFYRLSATPQMVSDLAETPTEVRFWVSSIGIVGSVPYVASVAASINWTPPANIAPGTYDYRAQLMAGTHPISDFTDPVYFSITAPFSGGNPANLAVFRNTASGPNTGLAQFWFAGSSNTFDAGAKGPRWFGLNGDIAIAGDWDGSGSVRVGVFRCPASGVCQWYIDLNNNGKWDGTSGGDAIWNFGLPGDQPVVGDWAGSGVSKIGVMRCPAAGQAGVCTWYLDLGNKHSYDPSTVGTYSFGLAGDKPVAGPFAGGTGDQIGVFRCPVSGVCQWLVDTTGQTTISTTVPISVVTGAVWNFGLPGDQPVVGNWNGTGTKRIGIFRNVGGFGQWFVDSNGNHVFDAGVDQVFSFGLGGDQALVGFWTLP